MQKATTDYRWGVERRLEFIEFRLFWEGGINRSDITAYFSVSVPQASKDLSEYQRIAPGNLRYDPKLKKYFKTDKFTPFFLKPDSDRFLSQLRSLADATTGVEETWLADPPPVDLVQLPHRHVDAFVLRTTMEAVRNRKAIEILYQSLSGKHPAPTWRWISPHAFAFDLHRWHVRAFCHNDRQYKDFLLPRFLKIREIADAPVGPERDTIWNEMITVVLKPNPKLNADQRRAIAQDYCMKDDRLHMPVRLALLYYVVRRLNLNVDGEGEERPATEQHVVLDNLADVKSALKRANNSPTVPEGTRPLERARS